MAKPRIIIADTDSSYIIPLQLRFVEEFFEKIDLEIITNKDYFEMTFASPQKAEIVIVSEDLYDSSLQKHNIGKIFMMMEQYEEDQTDELNINRIFKYTSIKEIFNEIIGKSANVLKVDTGKKSEPQIILVYSASGGVGKTTIALGMAACLTQNYKKVLYINASWLQSFQRVLENKAVISLQDVYTQLGKQPGAAYESVKHVLRKELFTYLPPFKASLMSLGLSYSVYEQIACSAKKANEYDFIIIDADTEFDDEKASLINVSDKVVIVTKQNAASVYSTNVLVSSINGINTDKYIFICNDYLSDDNNALVSPEANLKFTVSDYVEHISNFDSLKVPSLAQVSGLQRVSFLVL
ncbi:MAG TPA: AAA family ATPase [Clostridiaceae bacterium]|nr:AAA family ATPase [Clostridiaceae bacterium]